MAQPGDTAAIMAGRFFTAGFFKRVCYVGRCGNMSAAHRYQHFVDKVAYGLDCGVIPKRHAVFAITHNDDSGPTIHNTDPRFMLKLAAQVAAAYSDGASPEVRVKAASGASERELRVARIPRDELQLARV